MDFTLAIIFVWSSISQFPHKKSAICGALFRRRLYALHSCPLSNRLHRILLACV